MKNNACVLATGLISQLRAQATGGGKKILALTAGTQQSYELLRQLDFFLAAEPQAAQLREQILHIPANEVLLYDSFSPAARITSARIKALYRLSHGDYGLVIINLDTLLRLVSPPSFFKTSGLQLKQGQCLDRQAFIELMLASGYVRCSQVSEPGEMAVRGALVDLFPAATAHPFRLEWLDNELVSLRSFEVESQTSIDKINVIDILPPHEFPTDAAARALFISAWQASFLGSARRHPLYVELSEGKVPAGIESFMPLFFEAPLASYFDYLPAKFAIYAAFDLATAAEEIQNNAQQRWLELGGEDAVLLPPERLLLTAAEFSRKCKKHQRVLRLPRTQPTPDLSVDLAATHKLVRLEEFCRSFKGRVLLVLAAVRRYNLLREWLGQAGLSFSQPQDWAEFSKSQDKLAVLNAELQDGLVTADWAIITESDLFGSSLAKRQVKSSRNQGGLATQLRDLSTFTPGELVVHKDYGLGRFLGLETREEHGLLSEYLVIEYAEYTKLFLPIHNLHFLTNYSSFAGSDPDYPLDVLGSKGWNSRRAQALKKIEDTAAVLLEIYARRQRQQGLVFAEPDQDYEEFVLGFPYEETPDQNSAINSVIADMTSAKKTDRLICGDVGFGKTEVAMRAAYLAVASGYQVAILTPTTLLAAQHLHTLRIRFAKTPFVVEGLTRLTSGANKLKQKLAAGGVDIIVGTHALLSKQITFAKLGLAVIDEEHRFGVRQKEKLKELHNQVDLLALSATPIPRTLNMALSGLRDISLLTEPPPGRLPIKTHIGAYSENIIKEAVSRELQRDGQIYYVFNDTYTIDTRAAYLQRLFPAANIAVIHGKLPSAALDEIMHDFYHNKLDILVCTSIIENGLDVPNANTLIIDGAEKFGMAQLHQLRGRVGRRSRQAFAYLLLSVANYDNPRTLQRMKALRENTALGTGFNLASHDLEIRGAGEILGAEQSGFVQRVGVEFYARMLEETVSILGRQRGVLTGVKPPATTCELELAVSAYLPDDYIEAVPERIRLYKQLNTSGAEAIELLRTQLIDRYGAVPLPAANLFEFHRLRLQLQECGIVALRLGRNHGQATISPAAANTLAACALLAEADSANYVIKKQTLHFHCEAKGGLEHLLATSNLLKLIRQYLKATN